MAMWPYEPKRHIATNRADMGVMGFHHLNIPETLISMGFVGNSVRARQGQQALFKIKHINTSEIYHQYNISY
jgi:hypothetical protein